MVLLTLYVCSWCLLPALKHDPEICHSTWAVGTAGRTGSVGGTDGLAASAVLGTFRHPGSSKWCNAYSCTTSQTVRPNTAGPWWHKAANFPVGKCHIAEPSACKICYICWPCLGEDEVPIPARRYSHRRMGSAPVSTHMATCAAVQHMWYSQECGQLLPLLLAQRRKVAAQQVVPCVPNRAPLSLRRRRPQAQQDGQHVSVK